MKTVLYLDQNYVSSLTKARLGADLYPGNPSYFVDLLRALEEAVASGRVVCPVSEFHHNESDFDTRLAPRIYETLEALYCGVQLHSFVHIVQTQARRALGRFLHLEGEEPMSWRDAFNRDPHSECVRDRIQRTTIPAFVDLGRQIKEYHRQQGSEPPSIGDFVQQKELEAREVIGNLYMYSVARLLAGQIDIFTVSGLDFMARLLRDYQDLMQREPAERDLADFLLSSHIRDIPFIDVYSSIRAAMAMSGEKRRTRGSDLEDVMIASSVVPYAAIFATDAHVKEKLRSTNTDLKYGCSVFGGSKQDVLQLTELVSQSAKATD